MMNILNTKMKYICFTVLCFASIVGALANSNLNSVNDGIQEQSNVIQSEQCLITVPLIEVIDGDTLRCEIDGISKKVRLIGIDAPESVNPDEKKNTIEGKIASDYLKEYLDGIDTVQLEYDVEPQDKYDRELCYVYVDGIMIQKVLLEQGYAKVMEIEPNTKMTNDFEKIEQIAKDNNVGLWNTGGE